MSTRSIIIGLDFGLKRIGIALAHSSLPFAVPATKMMTLPKEEATVNALLELLKSYGTVEKIVMGLPLLLSGQEGEMCQKVRSFAALLEAKGGKEVVLLDERLTSKQAETLLTERKMNRKERAAKVDVTSATLILQTYLDSTTVR